jgi:uncharacterized protein
MSNPFDENRLYGAKSSLVEMKPDDQGRYEFELWSQYTRLGLDSLQVGDLVAVENYTPPKNGNKTYSILTLTQVFPVHFACQSKDAYPGHVFESMKSVKEDWEKQSDKPLHPTTTIKSFAVSTGWEFEFNPRTSGLPLLKVEKNLPMIGAEIRPLSMEMVEAIINHGMADQPNSSFNHKKFEGINIRLDVGALLTTHFGIFGFTGVGKSNLVSSMVIALSATGSNRLSNVVVMDPNDEYIGLLIDKFSTNPAEMTYIHVGTDSLPLMIIQNLGNRNIANINNCVDLLHRQMILPSRLKNNREIQNYIRQGLTNVLSRTRIALPSPDLSSWIRSELRRQIDPRSGPAVREVMREIENAWTHAVDGLPINAATVQEAVDSAEGIGNPIRRPLQNLTSGRDTANGAVDRTVRSLRREHDRLVEIPQEAIISINELIALLNNNTARQTVLITSRRDTLLKEFAAYLGNELYESRRRQAILEPHTIFLFDEADLFIPQEISNEETEHAKDLCVTLARRGRKFGLGIGISTQRAALLDTEVMGNLHTYFVSKLPRALDRQRVAEAFGIGEDQLSPTFTFVPGNWLIISHDSTGIKGVPIPTRAHDANERIIHAASQPRRGT